MKLFEVIGHRGAGTLEDENTLESFKKASEIGCTRIELDIHISSDGHAVIIHDSFLDKTTNGTGLVQDLTLSTIKKFVTKSGYQVPELSELFTLFKGKNINFQIELKGKDSEKVVPGIVTAFGLEQNVRYTSFIHTRVKTAMEETPGAEGGLLMCSAVIDPYALLQEAGAQCLHLNKRLITAGLVEKIHKKGCKVIAWDHIIKANDFLDLVSSGVDGATTDRPDLFLRFLMRNQAGSLNRKK